MCIKKIIDATAPADLFRLGMLLVSNWFGYEQLRLYSWWDCDQNAQQTSKTRARCHYFWNKTLAINAVNHCRRQRHGSSFQKGEKCLRIWDTICNISVTLRPPPHPPKPILPPQRQWGHIVLRKRKKKKNTLQNNVDKALLPILTLPLSLPFTVALR